MKIAFIMKNDIAIIGSKYKYKAMLEKFAEVVLIRDNTPEQVNDELCSFRPDYIAVMGDKYLQYQYAILHKIPYLLFQNDIGSMRTDLDSEQLQREKIMITNAYKIICTSENHAEYMLRTYGADSLIIYLRPLRRDLDFDPLPKLPGKTLVYAGGLTTWGRRKGSYGYRAYQLIFRHFKQNGWKVHVYPGYDLIPSAKKDYKKYGVIVHDRVPEGRELYRELSQYTAGFQGYNPSSTPRKVLKYGLSCMPNKLFLYLSAGIPTISYNGGKGTRVIIEGGWGVKMNSINNIDKIILPTVTDKMRYTNVIDDYVDLLRDYILNRHNNTVRD